IIAIDEILVRTSAGRRKLPPLAVGIGIYLPMTTTAMVTAGAIIGTIYNKWVGKTSFAGVAQRLGVLLASGMIVGESLFGVLNAGLIVGSGNGDILVLLPDGAPWSFIVSVIGYIGLIAGLYAWTKSKAAKV